MTTVTVTIEQQSLEQELTSYFIKTNFDVLNDIVMNDTEPDDLESIMTTEFAQGLPSDTEFSGW